MKLLPSLKQKKRYVVFEIISDQDFSKEDMEKEVFSALKSFLGDLGLSKAVPLFVKFKSNKFIMKVNHNYTDELKSALILIKKIKNMPVILKSVITSGTIKKASTQL